MQPELALNSSCALSAWIAGLSKEEFRAREADLAVIRAPVTAVVSRDRSREPLRKSSGLGWNGERGMLDFDCLLRTDDIC